MPKAILYDMIVRMASDTAQLRKDIGRAADETNKHLKSIGDSAKKTSAILNLVRFEFYGQAIRHLIWWSGELKNFVRALVESSDQMMLFQARIIALGGQSYTFDSLVASANKLGVALKDTGAEFARFSVIRDNLKYTDQQILKLSETMKMLGHIGGSTTEEIRNASTQLIQTLANTTPNWDEFRAILESTPLIIKELVAELEVGSVGTFKKLVAEGQISSQRIGDAVLAMFDRIYEKYKLLPDTLEKLENRWTTQKDLLTDHVNKVTGLATKYKEVLMTITEIMRLLRLETGGEPVNMEETASQSIPFLLNIMKQYKNVVDGVLADFGAFADNASPQMKPIFDELRQSSAVFGTLIQDYSANENSMIAAAAKNPELITSHALNVQRAIDQVRQSYLEGYQDVDAAEEAFYKHIATYAPVHRQEYLKTATAKLFRFMRGTINPELAEKYYNEIRQKPPEALFKAATASGMAENAMKAYIGNTMRPGLLALNLLREMFILHNDTMEEEITRAQKLYIEEITVINESVSAAERLAEGGKLSQEQYAKFADQYLAARERFDQSIDKANRESAKRRYIRSDEIDQLNFDLLNAQKLSMDVSERQMKIRTQEGINRVHNQEAQLATATKTYLEKKSELDKQLKDKGLSTLLVKYLGEEDDVTRAKKLLAEEVEMINESKKVTEGLATGGKLTMEQYAEYAQLYLDARNRFENLLARIKEEGARKRDTSIAEIKGDIEAIATTGLPEWDKKIIQLNKEHQQLNEKIDKAKRLYPDIADKLEELRRVSNEAFALESLNLYNEALDKQDKKLIKQNSDLDEIKKKWQEIYAEAMGSAGLSDKQKAQQKYAQDFIDIWSELDKKLAEGRISQAEHAELLNTYWEQYWEMIDNAETAFGAMTEFAKEAAKNMQDAFSEMFFDFMQGKFDSLMDIVNNFKIAMDRVVANMLAAQALAGLFGEGYGTSTTKIGGFIGGLMSGRWFGQHRGGVVGIESIPRLHSGGMIKADEVPTILQRGEIVLTPRQMEALGRNTGVNVTMNIATPDVASFRKSQGQIQSEVAKSLNAASRRYL